jgi:DNA mismatch endonuclease (patch repair protein)
MGLPLLADQERWLFIRRRNVASTCPGSGDGTRSLNCRCSALLCMGFRYRLDVKQLPGCPDIVMPKYRIALFVHSCFWHSHNCKSGQVRPKTNEEFWAAKRARTIQRDSESSKALAESGWRVVSLWECEINRAPSNWELQDFLLSRLTTEGGVASILLNSLINAACDGTPGHPSSEQDVNGVLAAVHGVRANDESRRCWQSNWLRRISLRHARCAV